MNLGLPFEKLRWQLRNRANGAAKGPGELTSRTARTGRILGVALLMFAAGFRIWDPLPVATLRLELFDTYQRSRLREVESISVLVIDIDEASLAEHGQWPWPRTKIATMIARLLDMGVDGILLDIAFPERDRLSPAAVAAALPELHPAIRSILRQLPDNDDRLAAVIESGPVVVAEAIVQEGAGQSRADEVFERRAGIATIGPDPRLFLPSHAALLHNIDELQAAASGIGINSFSVDRDGILRRLPLLFQVDGYPLLPGASIELLRVARGESTIQVRSDESGIRSITVGDLVVPTNAHGEIWLAFAPIHPGRNIPAATLLSGEATPELFAGKLVIIGSTATGLKDFRATPVAAAMPGVNILAQTIEGILAGSFLKRPSVMVTVELLLLGVVGAIVIWAVPHLGAIGNIGLSLGLALLLISASWILFATQALLLDWSFPVLAATSINIMLMFMKFSDERRARELVRQQLSLVQQEMEAARRVQQAILPTVFPDSPTLQLHAGTWPAREVGGDFYDILSMPDGRIGFAVADVSGKGMDAALFMAVSRTLLKAYAHTTSDPGTCLERLNEDLSEDNDACMFVTIFYGVIDPATGRVYFANGGHNPPYLKRHDGTVEQIVAAEGFAIGVVPGAIYQTKTMTLEPGDAIILYTDGVTEAFSPAREEYTERRLHDVLRAAESVQAEPLVQRVVSGVREFVGDGTQSDDITCMAVVYPASAGDAPTESSPAGSA